MDAPSADRWRLGFSAVAADSEHLDVSGSGASGSQISTDSLFHPCVSSPAFLSVLSSLSSLHSLYVVPSSSPTLNISKNGLESLPTPLCGLPCLQALLGFQ